jgi:RsiW-degrading membrane proteinase PrsW (M82 family)
MKICPRCQTRNFDDAKFCKHCKNPLDAVSSVSVIPPIPSHHEEKVHEAEKKNSVNGNIYDSINQLVGNSTEHVDVNLSDLYSNAFKRHSIEEAENIFICGTRWTTPPLNGLSSTWPKPWLYSRVFLVFAIAFMILFFAFDEFDNSNVIPGIIFVGTMIIPVTVLIFFMEVNVFRNVSFYKILEFFLVGGCASILLTLLIMSFLPDGGTGNGMDLFQASMVGIGEELGKMLIVYYFIKRTKGCNFILNGMLIGAAVGAGFSVFESAGYVNKALISNVFASALGHESNMTFLDVLFSRSWTAPGGHVVWAAMSGAAIMYVKKNYELKFSMLFDVKFLKVLIIPILLHTIWDWDALYSLGNFKLIILIISAWTVIIALINSGLSEIKKYKY